MKIIFTDRWLIIFQTDKSYQFMDQRYFINAKENRVKEESVWTIATKVMKTQDREKSSG